MKKPTHKKTTHKKPEKIYSLPEADDRLRDLFDRHGLLNYPQEKRKQLAQFYIYLMEHQRTDNVTRLINIKDVGIKHFVDSLFFLQFTKLKFPLMDMGTGPGFPGIPLKIHFPLEPILLAEGVQKRVNFLKDIRDKMKFCHLPILGRNINQECFYPVQGVITRAVETIQNSLENVLHSLQIGGKIYFLKGPGVDPEISSALKNWGKYFQLCDDISYQIPNTPFHRRLVVFEKIKTHFVDEEFLESLGLVDEND